mmetsp:Transcript_58088/g.67816  ORF Transcript_58088/g.67816 Transcript_58088/m.67816 type:complete len:88 (+) Transcript_58088:239-502(+)
MTGGEKRKHKSSMLSNNDGIKFTRYQVSNNATDLQKRIGWPSLQQGNTILDKIALIVTALIRQTFASWTTGKAAWYSQVQNRPHHTK